MSTESTSRAMGARAGRAGAEGAEPAGTESCHRHGELPRIWAQTRAQHTAHSTHTAPTGAPASPALGWARGLGMGTRTRMGAGAPVGRGSSRGFTRVWLAESMVASVLSPCRGTSGIVPNFCLARSEEERRRRTTGRRSSCCAQGQGGDRGQPCQPQPCPQGGMTSLHSPEP